MNDKDLAYLMFSANPILNSYASLTRKCTEKTLPIHPPWDSSSYPKTTDGKTDRNKRFISDVCALADKADMEIRKQLRDEAGKLVCTLKMEDEKKGLVPQNLILVPPKLDAINAKNEKRIRITETIRSIQKEMAEEYSKIEKLVADKSLANDSSFEDTNEILIVVRNKLTGETHEIDIGKLNHINGATMNKSSAREQVMEILQSIRETDLRVHIPTRDEENRFLLENAHKSRYLEMLKGLCNILQDQNQ